MRHLLALPCVLLAASALAADAPAPGRKVLVGDFMERGAILRGVPHDQAVVQVVNDTDLALEIALGPGTGTMKPRESLLLRVPLGQVPLRVTCPGQPEHRLEADLSVDRTIQYGIILALVDPDAAPPEEPEKSKSSVARQPPPASGSAETTAPEAPAEAAPAPSKSEPKPAKAKASGKVDIGRRKPPKS
jgi:hypothetical protein